MAATDADLAARPLDVVGIGSMVVDRIHRVRQIAGADAKALIEPDAHSAAPQRRVGGVTLNHLGWAAALGVRCGIFGRQGDDDDGRFLRAAMDAHGIERDLVLAGDERSSHAEIFVDPSGARAIYMAPGATASTTAAYVREHGARAIARARRLTTEISQLPLAAVIEALEVARAAGCETWLDLDIPPAQACATLGTRGELERAIELADVLKPSKSAAFELAGVAEGAPALEVAMRLRDRGASRMVAITDGARGCAIATADGVELAVAAVGARVIDTTGAGDAFLGGLLAASCAGLSPAEAARFANVCGAACAEQVGAFPDSREAARSKVLAGFEGSDAARERIRALFERAASASRAASEASAAPGAEALRALAVAGAALADLRARALGRDFARAADIVSSSARCHTAGVGKAGHVARYAAALLASTGTPAQVLDPLEALHGSLGQLVAGDVLIAISQSGETEEMIELATRASSRGVRVICVTGSASSRLAKLAGAVLDSRVSEEGGPIGLAPRASVAAAVAVVAALAAELQARAGQTRADYAELHPGGELGRRARE